MVEKSCNRKDFFSKIGKIGFGACTCGIAGMFAECKASVNEVAQDNITIDPASDKRLKFMDNWIRRFMDVLDKTVDKETKTKIMMENGKVCYDEYSGGNIRQITFEQLKQYVKNNPQDQSIRIEGNTIYFQYMIAAATGQAAPAGKCLCALVETKPTGLSTDYCLCSVGYIKEWYELLLGQKVDVELLESVLKGGQRCKFKITLK